MAMPPPATLQPRLSFAKVAASANTRPNPPIPSENALPSAKQQEETISEQDSEKEASQIPPIHVGSQSVPSVHLQSQDTAVSLSNDSHEPAGSNEIANSGIKPAISGPLGGIMQEENCTQLSSSESSMKPASLDGKSVASATTFALDEKESLRPDDSASVKATEDEDALSTGMTSRIGSDTVARAFSDQLHEIAVMDPSSRQILPGSAQVAAIPSNPGVLYAPSPLAATDPFPATNGLLVSASGAGDTFQPDEKLLEALNSPRDRLWVLKLEQDVTDFVKDSTEQAFDVPQCNSFYRMLAHRMADYYLLGHIIDSSLSSVRLFKTPNCRIPPRLTSLTNPSTAASTPPPGALPMKILRRSGNESQPGGRHGVPSNKPGSDGDGDSGSDGDGVKSKAPASREEREARYEAARLRILGAAKPSEDQAIAKEIDESRSSSAAGKKKMKKVRSDSEDGFEARSAFNTYTTTGVAADGVVGPNPATQMYPQYAMGFQAGYGQPSSPYATQEAFNNGYPQVASPNTNAYPWSQQPYSGYQEYATQGFGQPQTSVNDLATGFQQSMSFHEPSASRNYAANVNPMIAMRSGDAQQAQESQRWNQSYSPQPSWPQIYPAQQQSPSHQDQGQYLFGMLPGQMQMAGKRGGNPNHPIPGSFNRQAFNPQSQSFIPEQHASPLMGAYSQRVMSPSNNPNMAPGYASLYGMQRQNSSHSQGSAYSSPRPGLAESSMLRSGHGLTHPLPQPVFSPSVPMPYQTSQQQSHPEMSRQMHENQYNDRAPSSIAKWGASASLPPKPPPPAGHDSASMQNARLSSFNSAAAARLPGRNESGMPFHPLPSMANFRPGSGSGSGGM